MVNHFFFFLLGSSPKDCPLKCGHMLQSSFLSLSRSRLLASAISNFSILQVVQVPVGDRPALIVLSILQDITKFRSLFLRCHICEDSFVPLASSWLKLYVCVLYLDLNVPPVDPIYVLEELLVVTLAS